MRRHRANAADSLKIIDAVFAIGSRLKLDGADLTSREPGG